MINEIMYHPQTENDQHEFIELVNRGTQTVNLTGWQFTAGVDYTFGNVSLAPNQFLVVAANTAAFTARYGAVANLVGGWTGTLSNTGETIRLRDNTGSDDRRSRLCRPRRLGQRESKSQRRRQQLGVGISLRRRRPLAGAAQLAAHQRQRPELGTEQCSERHAWRAELALQHEHRPADLQRRSVGGRSQHDDRRHDHRRHHG